MLKCFICLHKLPILPKPHLARHIQGQEGPAEAILDKYTKEGGWVFLDNVHLMQGWIPNLERKLEIAAETAHPDFRCFFSAEPINGAPQVSISFCHMLVHCVHVKDMVSGRCSTDLGLSHMPDARHCNIELYGCLDPTTEA